jgi:hypothetical protein
MPIKPAVVRAEERTTEVTIETRRGRAYLLQVSRELVQYDAGGNVVSADPTPAIARTADDIAAESVEVSIGGKTVMVSAALIMEALPAFFDRWAGEDAAKPIPVGP